MNSYEKEFSDTQENQYNHISHNKHNSKSPRGYRSNLSKGIQFEKQKVTSKKQNKINKKP